MTWFIFALFFNLDLQPRIVWMGESNTREECLARSLEYRTYDNVASSWCELRTSN